MYTLETLSKINKRFLSAHYDIWQTDVDKANTCVERIEKSRTSERSMPGDIVRYTDEYGYYHSHAYIEKIWDEEAYIAESASVYCYPDEEEENGFRVYVSAGGPFHSIPLKKMTYTKEQEEQRFWHFGHCGGCADGGIDFFATVNVWECDMNKERYSTRNHNKYYVFYDPHPEKHDSNYKFSSSITKSYAWETEIDFQAWLRTFRGVVQPGNWENQLIVWTYKNIEHHVSPDEYEALNALEDTFIMNGSIRKCKRIYDDENYAVHTYFVWYWDEPGKDFYEQATEQNKVIDSYTLDWWTHKENEYARKELESGKIQPVDLGVKA